MRVLARDGTPWCPWGKAAALSCPTASWLAVFLYASEMCRETCLAPLRGGNRPGSLFRLVGWGAVCRGCLAPRPSPQAALGLILCLPCSALSISPYLCPVNCGHCG